MDLNRLVVSVENVRNALEVSGLQHALRRYNQSADSSSEEHSLTQAADAYMDHAAAFSSSDHIVVQHLKLEQLQSPGFWFDLTASPRDEWSRALELLEIACRLEFASTQLPKLLSFDDGKAPGSGEDSTAIENTMIQVRIHDAVEKASFPDRLSRLIDGVDLIYRSCADLAEESPDELEVVSVDGAGYKAVRFKGHVEVATATRRIIRALYQKATSSLQEDNYSVERIAEEIPFMHAIDELFRVKALDAEAANDIREGVLAGSIMLLECGVRIHGDRFASTGAELPDRKSSKTTTEDAAGKAALAAWQGAGSGLTTDDELEYLILNLNKKFDPSYRSK